MRPKNLDSIQLYSGGLVIWSAFWLAFPACWGAVLWMVGGLLYCLRYVISTTPPQSNNTP